MKKTFIWMISFILFYGISEAQTPEDTYLEIYQVKVTEGHATLVVTKSISNPTLIYKSVLIDAGEGVEDAELIEELILDPEVANGRLDVVMVTHHDKDHWGGLQGSNGLLNSRCNTGGSLVEHNRDSRDNPRPLFLYYSLRDDNAPTSTLMEIGELQRVHPNYLRIRHWDRGLDIDLIPRCGEMDIKINTLAINGFRRGTTDNRLPNLGRPGSPTFKNKNSAVATIVWGEFSFLIQGDLMSAKSSSKIIRTSQEYRREEAANRFPTEWDASEVQSARPATPQEIRAGYSTDYFVRKLNNTKVEGAAMGPNFPSTSNLAYPHWVAHPDRWHHLLGNTINNFNGSVDKYGHSCVALVPHHGALTSNHWFNTSHAVIGSNKNSKNGHPNVKAISSLFNTSQATNFYITYLLDNQRPVSNQPVINRLTEMRELLNYNYLPLAYEPQGGGYLPEAKVFYLDGGAESDDSDNLVGPVGTVGHEELSYFKFTVRHDGQFKVETEAKTETDALRDWAPCEGH